MKFFRWREEYCVTVWWHFHLQCFHLAFREMNSGSAFYSSHWLNILTLETVQQPAEEKNQHWFKSLSSLTATRTTAVLKTLDRTLIICKDLHIKKNLNLFPFHLKEKLFYPNQEDLTVQQWPLMPSSGKTWGQWGLRTCSPPPPPGCTCFRSLPCRRWSQSWASPSHPEDTQKNTCLDPKDTAAFNLGSDTQYLFKFHTRDFQSFDFDNWWFQKGKRK